MKVGDAAPFVSMVSNVFLKRSLKTRTTNAARKQELFRLPTNKPVMLDFSGLNGRKFVLEKTKNFKRSDTINVFKYDEDILMLHIFGELTVFVQLIVN